MLSPLFTYTQAEQWRARQGTASPNLAPSHDRAVYLRLALLALGCFLFLALGLLRERARPALPLLAPTEADFAADTPRGFSGARPWTAY